MFVLVRSLPFEAASAAAVRHHDFAEPPGWGGGVAGVRLLRPVKDGFESIRRKEEI